MVEILTEEEFISYVIYNLICLLVTMAKDGDA